MNKNAVKEASSPMKKVISPPIIKAFTSTAGNGAKNGMLRTRNLRNGLVSKAAMNVASVPNRISAMP